MTNWFNKVIKLGLLAAHSCLQVLEAPQNHGEHMPQEKVELCDLHCMDFSCFPSICYLQPPPMASLRAKDRPTVWAFCEGADTIFLFLRPKTQVRIVTWARARNSWRGCPGLASDPGVSGPSSLKPIPLHPPPPSLCSLSSVLATPEVFKYPEQVSFQLIMCFLSRIHIISPNIHLPYYHFNI